MKRWHIKTHMQIVDSRVDSFLEAIARLSKCYGLTLSHEDTGGGFVVEDFKETNIEWLMDAMNGTDSPSAIESAAGQLNTEQRQAIGEHVRAAITILQSAGVHSAVDVVDSLDVTVLFVHDATMRARIIGEVERQCALRAAE